MRLTASRIIVAPCPVFHSLAAGPSTPASALATTNRTSASSASCRQPAARSAGPPAGADSREVLDRVLLAAGGTREPWPRRRARPALPSAPSCGARAVRDRRTTRAAANASDAAASPVAQTSMSRCSASSRCCRPSSYRGVPGATDVAAAEPAALVAQHRLDGRQQLGRGHRAHGHARPPEHGVDDLAVAGPRHDHAVLTV